MQTSDHRFRGGISTSSLRNLLPRSISSKKKNSSNRQTSRTADENTPPFDPNIQVDNSDLLPSVPNKSPLKLVSLSKDIAKSDGKTEVSMPPDPPVKVVVRVKPLNDCERGGDRIVRKCSSDSITIGERKFTFDSVLESNANQDDIFQLVGVPLVKNALAGFNTSILSYGQTASGKTYTMWGPPSAMVEDGSSSSQQGIVPRIFQMLFSKIQREQEEGTGKQINYQCRCSFLEIYNEQIGDLLDPTQRNLEIKDDAKNGFYVENLTEEYITCYEDVTQLLVKGLSNRKVGATRINSKSSRSHVVFSCIIESWCKGTSTKCFGSSKSSRISLVDLAGLERDRADDAGRQCLKEDKYIKKSVAQLGHLVNILAEGTRSGKSGDIPYRSSCLTHLLQESLGGNAKLTVICAISPDNTSSGETLSTLRFGLRAKQIQNNPVINEITEDDVNGLSDKIRQLKEELIRAKSITYNSVGNNDGYFSRCNVRESLNQLRLSLNRSLILHNTDKNDSEEEIINVNEEDVKELHMQINKMHTSFEEILEDDPSENKDPEYFTSLEESIEGDGDLTREDDINIPEEIQIKEENNISSRSSLSISLCAKNFEEPPVSESPKIGNIQRKSMSISSNVVVNQISVSESSNFNPDVMRQSVKYSDQVRASLRSSKIFACPTESLAASLRRGLEIIDSHQRNSASKEPSVVLSFDHLSMRRCQATKKADVSIRTLLEENTASAGSAVKFVCASCRETRFIDSTEVEDSLKTWIIPVNEAGSNDAGKDLAENLREKELEMVCTEQAAKIEQLNHLVEQYKIEFDRRSNGDIGIRKNELNRCCNDEESHSESDIKEVQEEFNYDKRSTISDANEKEALLKEIEHLRSKLQSSNNLLPNKSAENLRSSLLSRSIQLRKGGVECPENNNTIEELEKERQRWTEMESDWISLTDELRIDIESYRRRAEEMEMELKLERRCTEELDDALHRSVVGHARFVEHYVELQEKHNDLVEKHRRIIEGIANVKRAAAKAGAKGNGSRFAKSLAAELSVMRVEREREREQLKKENKSLRIQLRDTAEAVHAAGELLVRLREAEEAASLAEDNLTKVEQENEKLKKQLEKVKKKHKMEMATMKQYLAESRLPESALRPLYREDTDVIQSKSAPLHYDDDDDQSWRAEFGAAYQEHY